MISFKDWGVSARLTNLLGILEVFQPVSNTFIVRCGPVRLTVNRSFEMDKPNVAYSPVFERRSKSQSMVLKSSLVLHPF